MSCALIAALAKYFVAAATLYDAVCLISVIAATIARNTLCVEATKNRLVFLTAVN